MATAVIATYKYPDTVEKAKELFAKLKSAEPSLTGLWVTHGLGCVNLGLSFSGDVPETFMNHLTMMLMPARWSKTTNKEWEGLKYDKSLFKSD